jgi:hypothetical protein
MTDHTPTPWAYRSSPHDDWGWIRGPKQDDGIAPLVAMARSGLWESVEMLDEHRTNKTDPYGANAAFIVKAVNHHDELVLLLHQAKAYLVINQLAPAIHGFEVANRKAYRDHLVEQIGAALQALVGGPRDD